MVRVFDSKKNEKKDLSDKKITMYVCGPTVYNDPHIGNIRPLLSFDVLHRLLKVNGYDVHYVHNITDIDDKIIEQALKTGTSESYISEKYTKEYYKLMEAFNVLIPEIHKVSDEIPDIINFVQKLVDNGYAYVSNGDVYFDVKKVKNYGEVSHNKIDELISNVRIESNEDKHDDLDFALWKKTDIGLKWDSPWGLGRPGWHTECVVMINKYLGDTITIHGGGVDLKFPHHENENAQNYGANNKTLADIFQYVGHLTIDGQKMSKSLGNVTLAKDLLQKYDQNELRWFFYQTHYSSPIDFSEKIMDDVVKQFKKIVTGINQFKTRYYLFTKKLPDATIKYDPKFLEILNDDLNFANGVYMIQNYLKILSAQPTKQNLKELEETYQYLMGAFWIFGLILQDLHTNSILEEIDEWNKYQEEKDYKKSDEIRNDLINKGII